MLRETNDKVVCLSTYHSILFETDKGMWKDYLRDGEDTLLGSYLAELGLGNLPDTSPDFCQAVDFTNLILNLTNRCNFRCSYCFREGTRSQTMGREIFEKAINLIPKFFNSDRCNVTYFGGEPLLLFPQIQFMTEYALSKLKGRRVSFSITTNGSLLSHQSARFLAANDFNGIVSLDSFEGVNCRTRRPKRGSSRDVYYRIIDNVRLLIELGASVSCNIVISQQNIETLSEFVTFLSGLGLHKITTALVSDKQHALAASHIDRLLSQEERITDLLLSNQSLIVEPISSIMKLVASHKLHLYRCGYGRLRINVQPDGTITPCQRVFVPIGNVEGGIDLSRSKGFAAESVDNRPVCGECAFRYLCGGNCYHESRVYRGAWHEPYGLYCNHFERLVSMVCEKMLSTCEPVVAVGGLRVV